jgi:hypothetical protein
VGPTPVRLYVEDESGNVEYCNTLVYVQDNLGICPPTSGNIDGIVQNLKGNALEEVKVVLQGTSNYSMTDPEGLYAFLSVPFGGSYTIRPEHPVDDLTGVTAMDLSVMLKHILGVEKFSSPYQYVAADMDQSGRVSVSDLLAMKELILKDYYGVEVATPWKFVDASYTFENTLDPLSETFPETYHIPVFSQDMAAVDFIGIKLGDLNSDARTRINEESEVLSRTPGVALQISEREFRKGESFEVTVSVDAFQDVEAMQFSLEIDPGMIDITGMTRLQHVQGLDIVNSTEEYGVVSALWYGTDLLTSPHLVSLNIYALGNGILSEALRLDPEAESIVYDRKGNLPRSLVTEYVSGQTVEVTAKTGRQSRLKVGQNFPNPFSGFTTIPVELEEDGVLIVEVIDMDGRVRQYAEYPALRGLQDVILNADEIGTYGVMMCRITAGDSSETLRIVIRPGA